jgi:hypothetical protein
VARRKFAGEVGSIVLGVLIALAIGEVAELIRWQVRAAYSNAAIDAELARVAGVLDERAMIQPCLDRRLEELDRLVRAVRSNNLLPVIGEIGRPPSRPVQTAAWEDASGSGTLLHFDAERRGGLSANYPIIADYPDVLRQERDLWAALSVLEGAPGRIPDDLITEVAVTIARLRGSSHLNGLVAQQTRDSILAGTGVSPSYFLILDREGTRAEVATAVRSRPTCQPLAVTIAN